MRRYEKQACQLREHGYHRQSITYDGLTDGTYQPIAIAETAEGHLWGNSGVLGLSICWEDGKLSWRAPVAERYLETHDEEAEARNEAAETRADTVETHVRELERSWNAGRSATSNNPQVKTSPREP